MTGREHSIFNRLDATSCAAATPATGPAPGPNDWAGVDAEYDRIFTRLHGA